MRQRTYLRQRYRAYLGYSGELVVVIGLMHLAPLLGLLFYPAQGATEIIGFLLASLPLIALGLGFAHHFAPKEPLRVTVQEGSVILLLVWGLGLLAGTIPFMFAADLNFSQAFFESTSAWTTTGLSVVDVTQASPLILLYRSTIQLAGGAGLAIIVLSALAGPLGYGLSVAEGRSDQLAPHVRQSAAIVLRLYVGYAVVGIIGLWAAGMSWFDAVNHAFTAISTGGFSTQPDSIGYWDSVVIEAVILVLMLLGTTNFLTAFVLLKGKWRVVKRNGEVRLMLVILPIAVVLLLNGITLALYPSVSKAIRVAIFETTSALSTTGFSTVSYQSWNDFGWLVLIVLMLIGGGAGSTAGGLKQYRVYIVYKAIVWEFRRTFMPPHAVNEPAIWQGERRDLLSDRQVRQVALFIGLYFSVWLLCVGVMTAHGYSLRDSLFESASTLSTVGLSGGVTHPDMPLMVLWTQILAMFLGRLEFFAVIVGILKVVSDARVLGLGKWLRRAPVEPNQ